MNVPDISTPANDAKEYAAADWATEVNLITALGGMAREIRIPLNATAGTLVIETAAGVARTFNVEPGDVLPVLTTKLKTTSTVTHLWVFV